MRRSAMKSNSNKKKKLNLKLSESSCPMVKSGLTTLDHHNQNEIDKAWGIMKGRDENSRSAIRILQEKSMSPFGPEEDNAGFSSEEEAMNASPNHYRSRSNSRLTPLSNSFRLADH